MPTNPSTEKRLRQNEKHRRRNRTWKSRARTARRRLLEALENDADEETLRERHREVISLVDQLVSRGIFHRNKGARWKSRLHRRVNRALDGGPSEG